MRRALLDIIACPKCRGDLELEVHQEDSEEVISGKLICKNCGAAYPIEDGIPNLLPEL